MTKKRRKFVSKHYTAKKNRENWVAALRSGEYEQGRSRLMTVEGDKRSFCCLGVLCDIVTPSQKEEWSIEEIGEITLGSCGGERLMLPPHVQHLVGLKAGIPGELGKLNDGHGSCLHPHSFDEIADFIEGLPE